MMLTANALKVQFSTVNTVLQLRGDATETQQEGFCLSVYCEESPVCLPKVSRLCVPLHVCSLSFHTHTMN